MRPKAPNLKARLAGSLLVALVAFVAGGCGGEQPVRIGVLADCRGPFGSVNDAAVGGAEFPLIEHGARLRGVDPGQGVTAARIAGRRVELVTGCTESGVFDILVSETRSLIELEHVDAVVGGFGNEDALIFREIARKYPAVPFVLASNSLREATVREAVPNVYRFEPDDAQQVAGLGTYAYRDLGWRRASIVADDFSWGWAQAEAFTAEFCALGGRIVGRLDVSPYDPKTSDVRRVPSNLVDGVAAFVTPFAGSSALVRALAHRVGDPAHRLILGPWISYDPAFRADVGRAAVGAVAGSPWLPAGSTPALRILGREFSHAFPRGSGLDAADAVTQSYSTAVTALIDALEAVNGDLSNNRRRFREALSHTVLKVPGPVRLDRNRQAIVDLSLSRLTALPNGKGVGLETIRTIHGIDETFGGLLPTTPESASSATCRVAKPPPWAR